MAVGLGFAACNEFDLPNPPGQSNPEEPVFESANLEIKQSAETLNLKADDEAAEKVTLAEVTKLVDFPAAYDLAFEVELAPSADFANAVTLPAELNDGLVQLEPKEINNAIYNNFTKDPADIDIYARIAAYAERGNTKIRLGGTTDFWYGDYEYLVIPFQPEAYLDNSYYLLQRAIGASNWDVTAALPFTHTSDASVYDNPEFKIAITVEEPGTEWAVIPGSSFDAATLDGIMGVEDATAMEGALIAGAEDMVFGQITEPSPYTIRIDVEAMTYQVNFAFDFLYVPGTATSMGFRSALHLTTTDYMNYSGVARLRQQWWLTSTESLQKGTIFYQAPGEDAASESIDEKTGIITYSGSLTTDAETGLPLTVGKDEAGKNIDGLFYIEANVALLTYKAIWLNQIGMVGDFNGWNTEEAIQLTHDSKYTTWTAKDVDLTAGGFKFCTGSWVVSWGGSLDNLQQGGIDNNLTIAEDGKYDVKLDFTKTPYTATLTKK